MGYSGPMGLSMEIPVHQVSGPEKLWGIGGYALWVIEGFVPHLEC